MSVGRQNAVPLTSASEEDLAALRRALAWTGGFALFVVVCDGPARAETIRRLKAWSGDGGAPSLAFFPAGEAGRAALERLLDAMDPGPPLPGAVIVDGDTLVEEETPVHALNAARDRLGRIVAGPLVILLAASREAELARLAPDLFDIRSATYELDAAAHATAIESAALVIPELWLHTRPARALPAGSGLLPDRLRALEASTTKPPDAALADVWLELGEQLFYARDLDGARAATKEAERLARAASYLHGRAASLRLLAGIEQMQGKLADASSRLRETIQILSDLGDKQGRAACLRQLAIIEVIQWNFDEARPLLHESIQISDELGDRPGCAASLHVLAGVEYFHGNSAEAHTLLRKSMQINNELGVRHGLAWSLVMLGQFLSAGGQREDGMARAKAGIAILEELGAPELAQAREILRVMQEIG